MNIWLIVYIVVCAWLACLGFSIFFGKFAAGESWKVVFKVATLCWLLAGLITLLIFGGLAIAGGTIR